MWGPYITCRGELAQMVNVQAFRVLGIRELVVAEESRRAGGYLVAVSTLSCVMPEKEMFGMSSLRS